MIISGSRRLVSRARSLGQHRAVDSPPRSKTPTRPQTEIVFSRQYTTLFARPPLQTHFSSPVPSQLRAAQAALQMPPALGLSTLLSFSLPQLRELSQEPRPAP